MTIIRALLVPSLALSLLSGCAYRNNYPVTQTFPIKSAPATMGVYVDANGTFYPDQWSDACPKKCEPFKTNHALLFKGAQEHPQAAAFRARIASEEKRQLADIAQFVEAHQRLFILIHGFNADQSKAKSSYDRIVDRLIRAPGDGVIEFYWDGFVTKPRDPKFSIAPPRFWKAATAHSQTAGTRGLRRILALAKNRDIVMISHSRGASVILSALSNPPYSDGFLTQTERLDFDPDDGIDGSPNFLRPVPLPGGRGNRFHLLMLAPAIGCIDFRRPDFRHRRAREMSKEGCSSVRPLPSEVKFLGYTLNKNDSVLGKYILPSEWYNATDFGYDAALGETLKRNQNWGFLTAFEIKQKHGHRFDCYINDPEFGDMLRAVNVTVAPLPKLPPPDSCVKGDKPQRKP
jgi:hypothetical protein